MQNHNMENRIFHFTKKVIKFYFVWWFALIWNLMITHIISDILKLNYNRSLVVILIFNCTIVFYLQKKFTFQNNEKNKLKQQIISYFVLLLFVLWSLKIFVPILNNYIPNYTICTFIVSWVMTIINFIIQNFFIFNNKKWQTNLSQ